MRETFISGSILPAIQPAFQKNVRSFHGVISYFCASLEKFCAVVGEGMSVEGQGRIVWYNTGQRRCRWVDMCAPWGRRQQRGSSHFLGELLQAFPGTVPPGLTSLPTELAGSLPIFEQGCSVRCIELPNMGLGFRFQSFGEKGAVPCPEMLWSLLVQQDFQLQSMRCAQNPLRTLKGLMRITVRIQKENAAWQVFLCSKVT